VEDLNKAVVTPPAVEAPGPEVAERMPAEGQSAPEKKPEETKPA
jgi:hypothetical protein